MKLKLMGTLAVLTGLCLTSCRNETDMEDNSISTEKKTIELNNLKIDSVLAFIENETKDPPKTEQQWRQNNNKQK